MTSNAGQGEERRSLMRWLCQMYSLHGDAEYKEAASTIDSLQAQVEVLKSALEWIAEPPGVHACDAAHDRAEGARAALTQVQRSPDANKETKV